MNHKMEEKTLVSTCVDVDIWGTSKSELVEERGIYYEQGDNVDNAHIRDDQHSDDTDDELFRQIMLTSRSRCQEGSTTLAFLNDVTNKITESLPFFIGLTIIGLFQCLKIAKGYAYSQWQCPVAPKLPGFLLVGGMSGGLWVGYNYLCLFAKWRDPDAPRQGSGHRITVTVTSVLPLVVWLVGLDLVLHTWWPDDLDLGDLYTAHNTCSTYLYLMAVLDVCVTAAVVSVVAVFYSCLLFCYKCTHIFDGYDFHGNDVVPSS